MMGTEKVRWDGGVIQQPNSTVEKSGGKGSVG